MHRKLIDVVIGSTLCLAACEHGSYARPASGPADMNAPSRPSSTMTGQTDASYSANASAPAPEAGRPQMAMSPAQPAPSMAPSSEPQGCAESGWGGGGPMRGGMGMGMGGMGMGMGMGTYSPGFVLAHSHELGLTDEQTQKIRNDMFATRQKMIDLRARSMKSRSEVNRLLGEPKVDQAAVDRQIQDSANATAEMRKLHVQAWLRTRALLNADQIKKLDELRAQNMPSRARWRTSAAP